MKKTTREKKLESALRGLLRHAESQICAHEETKRGGVIWTICTMCGKKWADDEGGFKPDPEPKAITAAHEALSS